MVHIVTAVYEAQSFDPRTRIATNQPVEYRCEECSFKGNLEQGVEHSVKHQFDVPFVAWEDRLDAPIFPWESSLNDPS